MAHSNAVLNRVYDRTDGLCHLCGSSVSWSNYGTLGRRGSWEVDHSVPRARGGTNHVSNLLPACISCNRSKQTRSTHSVRRALTGHRALPRRRVEPEQPAWPVLVGALVLGGLTAALIALPAHAAQPKEYRKMSQFQMAHLQEQGINFAVFGADSVDRSSHGRDAVLSRLTAAARRAGLRVDQAALAFHEGGRTTFFGTPDLVSFLVNAGWRPGWTGTLTVDD